MTKTNNRCVQAHDITLDVAKFGEIFHKFNQYSHF